MSDIEFILKNFRNVAIVGLSKDPEKYSHIVAKYLKEHHFRIIPVNPFVDEVLGEKGYKSLLDIPENIQKSIEIIDIFRRSEDVPLIIDQAIQLKMKNGKPLIVWMQLGIENKEAAEKAAEAGLIVVMNRCLKIEHQRLCKGTVDYRPDSSTQ